MVVLGGGGRRRQNSVQDVLRVVADSIEKSVVALRQLLAEVFQSDAEFLVRLSHVLELTRQPEGVDDFNTAPN